MEQPVETKTGGLAIKRFSCFICSEILTLITAGNSGGGRQQCGPWKSQSQVYITTSKRDSRRSCLSGRQTRAGGAKYSQQRTRTCLPCLRSAGTGQKPGRGVANFVRM